MRIKHDFGSDEDSEGERPPDEGDETYPLEQELPLEEADPWEAEEEASRWMQGEVDQGMASAQRSEVKGSCASGDPLWEH